MTILPQSNQNFPRNKQKIKSQKISTVISIIIFLEGITKIHNTFGKKKQQLKIIAKKLVIDHYYTYHAVRELQHSFFLAFGRVLFRETFGNWVGFFCCFFFPFFISLL